MIVNCPTCQTRVTEIQEVPMYNKYGISLRPEGMIMPGVDRWMDIVSVCRCSGCGNEFVIDEVDIEVK